MMSSLDENNLWGYSHRVIIIRAIIHTALFSPIWWAYQWVHDQGFIGLGTSLMKFIFYANNFYMALFWFFVHSIAKGTEPGRRDIAKYILFWLSMHVLMDLSLIMDQLKWPP